MKLVLYLKYEIYLILRLFLIIILTFINYNLAAESYVASLRKEPMVKPKKKKKNKKKDKENSED